MVRLSPRLDPTRVAVDIGIAELFRPPCPVVAATAFGEAAREDHQAILVIAEQLYQGFVRLVVKGRQFLDGEFELNRPRDVRFHIAVGVGHGVDDQGLLPFWPLPIETIPRAANAVPIWQRSVPCFSRDACFQGDYPEECGATVWHFRQLTVQKQIDNFNFFDKFH